MQELHIKKAGNENLKMLNGANVKVSPIDNHSIHMNEHIAFMLGHDFELACEKDGMLEEKFLVHINQHKEMEEK